MILEMDLIVLIFIKSFGYRILVDAIHDPIDPADPA